MSQFLGDGKRGACGVSLVNGCFSFLQSQTTRSMIWVALRAEVSRISYVHCVNRSYCCDGVL